MDETVWDSMIRVAMTHRILEDGLSPMEALAFALKQDCGCSTPKAAEIMSRMAGRNVTTSAVRSYMTKARDKVAEKETPEDDSSGEAAMAYRAEGRDRLS